MPNLYLVSGLVVSSDVELTTLTPADRTASVAIVFGMADGPAPEPREWFLERRVPGTETPFMSTARVDGGYLIDFGARARFWVREDGSEVRAYAGELAADAMEQLLVDQVLPQTLQLRGQCALHASSVALAGEALAFLGPSGMGKSTLASALVPPGTLVSDDCLAVRTEGDRVLALPSYPSVRLRPDSAANVRPAMDLSYASSRMTWKRRLPLPESGLTAARLTRAFILEHGERIDVVRLGPSSIVAELAKHVHRLDPRNSFALAREFATLAAIAERVEVFRLAYPRAFRELPDVVRVLRS